jgi:hypothetical protein
MKKYGIILLIGIILMAIITDAFNDITRASDPQREGVAGQPYLDNMLSMQIGDGTKVMRADSSGIWLGGKTFATAPFSVDMEGNMTATSLDLSAYVSKAGADQVLSGSVQVGNGNVKIDGVNKRILINDGSYDRILIGYQSGGF